MLSIRNVLVPTDFSPCADHALSVAGDLTNLFAARLHVLHVIRPGGRPYGTQEENLQDRAKIRKEMEENACEAMRKALREHAPSNPVTETRCRWADSPAQMILEYADKNEIDLLVVGTRGRSGFKRAIMGSVTEEVVRRASCPVCTVRLDTGTTSAPEWRRILVPVDFSDHARLALIHAKCLAWTLKARVDLVHVAIPPPYLLRQHPELSWSMKTRDWYQGTAAVELRRFDEISGGPEVAVGCQVVEGHTVQSIIEFAQNRAVDLIVCSSHGLGGLERYWLGSVTEKVIRHAPCPVLTVKSFGKSLVAVVEQVTFDGTGAA